MGRRAGANRRRGHRCLTQPEIRAQIPSWELSKIIWTEPQRRLLEAVESHDFVIYSGGNFAGKTLPAVAIGVAACLGWFACEACGSAGDPACPACKGTSWCPVPADVMLVGLAKAQARDAMQKYLTRFIPESQIHRQTSRESLSEVTEFCGTGSLLSVYTAGQGEEVHQGGRRSVILYDEQSPQRIVEEGMFRMRDDMESRIIMTMTPTQGQSWVYDQLVCKAEEKGIALVRASVFENGIAMCHTCDRVDTKCRCTIPNWYTPPCGTCGKDRKTWDKELLTGKLRRQTPEVDALCWRCKTYGVEPRLTEKKARHLESRVEDPKRLAMRMHGSWEELRGDRCFKNEQIKMLRQQTKAPIRTEGGCKIWQEHDDRKQYVSAVDAAMGTGNDSTVIGVIDCLSGEQVTCWADKTLEPAEYIGEVVRQYDDYGKAKVWCENISGGYYLIPQLDEMGVRQYRNRAPDRKTGKVRTNQLGFAVSPRGRERILQGMIAGVKLNIPWVCACHETESCPDYQPLEKVLWKPCKGGLIVRDRRVVDQLERLFYDSEDGNKIKVTSGHDDFVFWLAGAHECRQRPGGYRARKIKPKLTAMQEFLVELGRKERARGPEAVHPFARGW